MQKVYISNTSLPNQSRLELAVYRSFLQRFLGLMFKSDLQSGEGALFFGLKDSISQSTIHMLFMSFDLLIIWVDSNWKILDIKIAKRWHPFYAPKQPSRHFLETTVDQFDNFNIGDQLSVIYV